MRIQIGNTCVKSGEKIQGYLNVENHQLRLPFTAICGKKEGPAILITAGIHGAEYIGIETAMQMSRELNPENIEGKIIFLLIANPQACMSFSRLVVPEDEKNLNRMFPGKKDGTLAEKIAYTIEHELQNQSNYHIDLHAGDTHERVMPFVYFPGIAREEVIEASRKMAMAADMEIRTKSGSSTGAYNYAAIQGIPSVLLERGGGGVFSQEEVELYKQDVRNILISLGIIKGQLVQRLSHNQKEITKATYIDSSENGFWYPALQAGDRFLKGSLLGRVTDVWGKQLDAYYAEYNGIVLYQTVGLGVEAGDSLIAYGMLEEI